MIDAHQCSRRSACHLVRCQSSTRRCVWASTLSVCQLVCNQSISSSESSSRLVGSQSSASRLECSRSSHCHLMQRRLGRRRTAAGHRRCVMIVFKWRYEVDNWRRRARRRVAAAAAASRAVSANEIFEAMFVERFETSFEIIRALFGGMFVLFGGMFVL